MIIQEQSNILSLVAATIFADKRVFSAEIDMFVKTAGQLSVLRNAKPKLTEERLLQWYEANKDWIRRKITTPYFKDWFYDLLDQLSNLPDKQEILDVMHKIALSDGTVHVSERALTALAKRYWGME